MNKSYLGAAALVSLAILVTSSSEVMAKGGNDNPVSVVIDDSGNTVKIDQSGSSIEPYRTFGTPGFTVHTRTCVGGSTSCSFKSPLLENFLLQYVNLTVRADPGGQCGGSASISVIVDEQGGLSTFNILTIVVAESNNDTTTLVLPVTIRMQTNDELGVNVSDHNGGGNCAAIVSFGGIQG